MTQLGLSVLRRCPHGLWRRYFRADPRVVGRTIALNGTGRTVLGVMPAQAAFPPGGDGPVELWAVLKDEPPLREPRATCQPGQPRIS